MIFHQVLSTNVIVENIMKPIRCFFGHRLGIHKWGKWIVTSRTPMHTSKECDTITGWVISEEKICWGCLRFERRYRLERIE